MRLIIGGDSKIGEKISSNWDNQKLKFHSSTRRKELMSKQRPFIDLSDLDHLNLEFNYDSAIFCASQTSLSECESNPKESRKINVDAISKLAEILNSKGTFLLFLSTNQVFDGKKAYRKASDQKNPINEYGRQKSDVEENILKLSKSSVLRLSKVINHEDSLLIEWKEKLNSKEKIKAFDDMTLSPTSFEYVIKKIDLLLKHKREGIFHCRGGKDISYYEYAKQFAKLGNYPMDLIEKDSYKLSKKITFTPLRYTSLCEE